MSEHVKNDIENEEKFATNDSDANDGNVSDSKTKSVAKSTASMAIATIMSRVTGLLRTWVMAFALGNTVITSAYQVANNMPNVVFDLVAGGLLGAAFIPIFMLEHEKHGREGATKFSCNMLNLLVLVLGALSLLATIFAPQVIATQTFTVDSGEQVTETAILFFRFFAFQILFYGISGVLSAVLNAERVYFMPAFAPACNNIFVILAFIGYYLIAPTDQMMAIVVLGIGTTLGVVVQCVMQIPSLVRSGFKWRPYISLRDPALIAAIKIAIPTFIYIVGTLIAFTCRNAFSLSVADNGPSTILYAWTWYQLPYGVIAVSLSRTMFTEMSEASAQNDTPRLRSQVNIGLSATLIMIIPLAILMGIFAYPLLSLFRAGSFNADDVGYVATILQLWVVSLPFYCVMMYLYNLYASIRKFGTFAAVSCLAVVLQCFLYWVFCREDLFGLSGIPVADFIYYFVCCVLLLVLLYRLIGSINLGSIVWKCVRVLAASVIGCVPGIILMNVIDLGQVSMLNGILQLCVCGGISLIIIALLCWAFRVPEVVSIADKIFGWFVRSGRSDSRGKK